MKLFRQLRKIKLTKPEKEDIRGVLLSFLKSNPVRNHVDIRHNIQKVTFLKIFLTSKPMIATLIAAILLAFGGGTAVAAENALPGDLLYPIKVKVNEEARIALASTAEAKVALEAKFAERRLAEAEKLAEGGKLTTSTSQMLANKFKEFSNKAEDRLDKLQKAGKLTEEQVQRLKENFEVAIKVHDEVLSRIQEKEQERENLKEVVDSLHEQASSTMKDRIEHEWELLKNNASTTLKTVADNRKNAAQNKISEVEKFIKDNADKVSVENNNEAVKKLAEAKKVLAEGDKAYAEAKYGEAIIKYSEAHRKAGEAKMYMTRQFNLRKELRDDDVTSTMPIVTTTLRFDDEDKRERFNGRESLKNLEEKLREEVKQTRENFQELKKETGEKIREQLKNENRDESRDKDEEDDKIEVNVSVSGTAAVTL